MINSYTYIKCDDCVRHGTPKCRHKEEWWHTAFDHACLVKVEDAGLLLKPKSKTEEDV